MKAIRIHEHGDTSVLKIEELEKPSPKPNEVLVQIAFSSLNHMDIWVRNGIPGLPQLPLTLGCDASGTIVAVGKQVDPKRIGERVFLQPLYSCGICPSCQKENIHLCKKFQIPGEHKDGTHAQFVAVPETHAIKLSDNLSLEEGASFALTFMTAWHMLISRAQIQAGEICLVMAAGSGVSSAAIQIAKLKKAIVIATAGTKEKLELAKKLGADFVIHHYEENLSKRVKEITNGEGAAVIIEHVGEKVFPELLKSLAWGGRLVTCGATTGPQIHLDLRHIFIKQQSILGSTMGTRQELLDAHEALSQKQIQVQIDQTFPFSEIVNAHKHLEASQHAGKILISWRN